MELNKDYDFSDIIKDKEQKLEFSKFSQVDIKRKEWKTVINATRTILNYLKIWFKVLSQSDAGSEFISGINTQVNLIHNLTFKQNIVATNINTAKWDVSNTKLMVFLAKLSKEQKKKIKYVKDHIKLFSKTEKWIKAHKNKQTAWVNKHFNVDDWKMVKKFKELSKFATNISQNLLRVKKRDENKNVLDESLAGNFLQQILNYDNDSFNKMKRSQKSAQAYIAAAYQTITLVFNNTKIKVDLDSVEKNYGKNSARTGALLTLIKLHQNNKAVKDIKFTFSYNNHSQYGDNDTYNQWIDNLNILTVNGNALNAFEKINWKVLLKNATLIDAAFASHNYKA